MSSSLQHPPSSYQTLDQRLTIREGSDHVDVDESRLPYESKRLLGHGGWGVVDEVEDYHTKRRLARKVIIIKRQSGNRVQEVFKNEVDIIRSLRKHHHIIDIYATYTTKDRLGMILSPLANDGDLERYLVEFLSLSDPSCNFGRASEMRRDLERAYGCLAAGLAFIHHNKIRHKDIKPHNILIHNGGVIYTDFGLSFDSNGEDNSTTEGPTEMTRRYAAPEVLAGGSKDSSSDVYSLGCVFIKIHWALDKLANYDDRRDFAEAMEDIHQELEADKASEGIIASSLIRSMTWRKPYNRRKAQDIWVALSKSFDTSCITCQLQPTDQTSLDESQSATASTGSHSSTASTNGSDQAAVTTTSNTIITPTVNVWGRTYWTPWKYSAPHGMLYTYLIREEDNRILDTRWASRSLLPPYATRAEEAGPG